MTRVSFHTSLPRKRESSGVRPNDTGSLRAQGRPIASRSVGFTLVEILVALAIIAVALTAGLRALAQSTDGAAALRDRTLALWVAQNRIALATLESPSPAPGRRQGTATQAGSVFAFTETISATPNPAFHKIEVVVEQPGAPDYALARLTGFIAQTGATP